MNRTPRAPDTITATLVARWEWLGIFVAALLAYLPALQGGFLWDDDAHVTKPALRSLAGLRRIWFEVGATQQYYPVLHSAFWLEHLLWGDSAWCYHLLNILLHASAACLLGAVLRRVGVPGAMLAALAFALHPVEVESVAWISEQKNTLSLVFYLLAALTYLKWEGSGWGAPAPALSFDVASGERAGDGAPHPGIYLLATFFFILALLTKTVTASLPAALLVVVWWKRGRLNGRTDVLPLIPWICLAAGGGILTAWVEARYIGAEGASFHLNVFQRVLLAGRDIAFYAGKLAWPAHLAFVYPRWTLADQWGRQCLFAVGAIAFTAFLWLARRWSRGPLAAWLFFVGSLFPALGFINVYPFIFSYVADHFQYLASMGPIALAASGAALLWDGASARRQTWVGAAVAVVLGFYAVQTFRQCRIYRDGKTLYRTTLAENPDCWLAHLNLGDMILESGNVDEAISHYREAERLEPNYPSTHFNLGRVLLQQGQFSEAAHEFRQSLRLQPADAEAHNNLGAALADLGQWNDAKAEFGRALALRPGYSVARANLDRLGDIQNGSESR